MTTIMKKFYYNPRWGWAKTEMKQKPKPCTLYPVPCTLYKGFTLIEVIVALFALGIILSIIGGVFSQALFFQRRALNAQKIEENLNLVMEAMAREVRVARIITPDNNCGVPEVTSVTIEHPVNGTVRYFLADNAVHREVEGVDSVMSSNTVQFTKLQFCISGNTDPDDNMQPRMTILASVQSTDTNQQAKEDYQTTLSLRLLDE